MTIILIILLFKAYNNNYYYYYAKLNFSVFHGQHVSIASRISLMEIITHPNNNYNNIIMHACMGLLILHACMHACIANNYTHSVHVPSIDC